MQHRVPEMLKHRRSPAEHDGHCPAKIYWYASAANAIFSECRGNPTYPTATPLKFAARESQGSLICLHLGLTACYLTVPMPSHHRGEHVRTLALRRRTAGVPCRRSTAGVCRGRSTSRPWLDPGTSQPPSGRKLTIAFFRTRLLPSTGTRRRWHVLCRSRLRFHVGGHFQSAFPERRAAPKVLCTLSWAYPKKRLVCQAANDKCRFVQTVSHLQQGRSSQRRPTLTQQATPATRRPQRLQRTISAACRYPSRSCH